MHVIPFNRRHITTWFVQLACVLSVDAASDSLILKNNDVIIGEIKSMDRGVLTMETDYSDSDFKIEWDGIRELYSVTNFLITLSSGKRYNGTLRTFDDKQLEIIDIEAGIAITNMDNVVYLKSVDKDFWSRLYASIDVGVSLTKANNLRQFNMRSTIGYLTERWSVDAAYNNVRSTQDEVEPTQRVDASLAFRKLLPKDWYLPADVNFLSNTEQSLQLRSNVRIGFGKYLIHTNRTYWGFAVGTSAVNEQFTSEDPDRKSLEGYAGTELNMFDIGDFSLLMKTVMYPGITEKGRWRSDFVVDTKYDLPLDFYIKLGITLNYDNQPVESATNTDYVLQTGIGWEL
jgi:hypothetical protein